MSSVADVAMTRSTAAARAPRGASARYSVCVALLAATAIAFPIVLKQLNLYTRKEAVPLKKPLHAADWRVLAPRYVLHEYQSPPPSEEILDTLGTREFLQWRLVDAQKPAGDSTRVIDFVATYYTGKPDLVPHVPEECMSAGGYDLVGTPDTAEIRVTGIGAPDDLVRARVSLFQAPQARDAFGAAVAREPTTILYFFHANGTYCTTRNEVRRKLSSPFEKYAYFMKIEIKFSDQTLMRSASPEQAVAALPDFLRAVMPVLLGEHLRWDELQATAERG